MRRRVHRERGVAMIQTMAEELADGDDDVARQQVALLAVLDLHLDGEE